MFEMACNIDEYDAEEAAARIAAQNSPKSKSRVEKLLENAGVLVGDTGFATARSLGITREGLYK